MLEEIEDELNCPITYKCFNNPVVTDDGYTFQKAAIKEWFSKSMKSPLAGYHLQNALIIKNNLIKDIASNRYQLLRKSVLTKTCEINQLIQEVSLLNTLINSLFNKVIKLTKAQSQMLMNTDINELQIKRQVQRQKLKQYIDQSTIKSKNMDSIQYSLSIIMEQFQIQDIEFQLEENRIYVKIDSDQMQRLTFTNVVFSQNSFILSLETTKVNFYQLTKHVFPNVQAFELIEQQISPQQFQLLILSLKQIFPNLKMLCFFFCGLDQTHWKFIMQNIKAVNHIQSLSLTFNNIRYIQKEDLAFLLQIQRLKHFKIFDNDGLLGKSDQNLLQFKQINNHIKIQYGAIIQH